MLVRLFAFVVAGSLFLSSANAGFFNRNGGCCDSAPSCGCEVAVPTCGCDVAPSCGCEVATPCCGSRKGGRLSGLLSKFRGSKSACCAPACDSCAPACDSCAAPAPCCAPAPAPTCCAPAPTCCAPAPTCCDAAPTCCDAAPSCGGRRHIIRDLLSRIKARKGSSSCCAPACDSCGSTCDSCGAPAASCGCGM